MAPHAVPEFPSVAALHAGYSSGALTPAEVLAASYGRIVLADDPGIFLFLLPEEETQAAAAALPPFDPVAKPLWGVPFAVKDNIDVAGMPTTAGCPDFAYRPERTATAVQRLLDAGAILLGKTNLDQFATGLVGVRTPYAVPRNAIDPAIVPGGSSSGSAVAVAHGIVSFALGSDTAGSGRVPAGLNNIVGLKPSLGTVSGTGMVPACRTLDTISVFAGTVDDAYAAFAAASGFDATDPFSRHVPVPARTSALPGGLRLAVPDGVGRHFGGDPLAEAAFAASVAGLPAALPGVTVAEASLAPFFAVAELLYSGPWVAERYQAIRPLIENCPEVLHPTTRRIIEGATRFSAADAFAGLYRLAELRRVTETLWERADILVVPSFPRPRTAADLAADPIGPNSELGTYTNFVNLLDLCALAVPGPFRPDGLPSGITLIAPAGQDALLAAAGAALHAAAGERLGATTAPVPPPPTVAATALPGEIELVVVGAHLSGMPLNHELTTRKARLLRAVDTAPDYRLFALPGGPPARPGLLRVAAGQGHRIATEVWAISPEGFGSFVAGIPAPLGIGTAVLADGSRPKGFIVEPEGLQGAEDVSRFGGWRNFVASRSG